MSYKRQKWDSLFRQLSIETLQVFIVFHETAIRDGGRIADVERELKKRGIIRNASQISKSVESLNAKFQKETFFKLIDRPKDRYFGTKYSEIVYMHALRAVGMSAELANDLNQANEQRKIHVAFSTFGLPFVSKILQKAKHNINAEISIRYMNKRTKDIPFVLKDELSLDFALGESLKNERTNFDSQINEAFSVDDEVESVIVGSEAIKIVSNFDLGKSVFTNMEARKLPVKTVDQGIMLKFLAILHDLVLPDTTMSDRAIASLIDGNVNLKMPLYDNVHTLIESFILDTTEEAVIFAGATVAKQIQQRRDYIETEYNKDTDIELTSGLVEADFKTPDKLDKRLFRRKRDAARYPDSHPYNAFWETAKSIQRSVMSSS